MVLDSTYFRRATFVLGFTYIIYSMNIDMLVTTFIGENTIDSVFCLGLFIASFLGAVKTNGFRINRAVFECIAIVCALFLLDYLSPHAIPQNRATIWSYFWEKSIYAILGLSYLKKEDIRPCLKYIAIICFATSFYIRFLPMGIQNMYGGEDGNYGASMLFGQHMTPAAVFFWMLASMENNKLYKALSIVAFVEILLLGNRGAVVCCGLFIIGYEFLFSDRKNIKIIVLAFFVWVGYSFLTSSVALSAISGLLQKFGLYSRNIVKFLDGSIGDTGRDYIYEEARRAINENWLFGLGVSGSWYNWYPHNIWLEIQLVFGRILGISIMAAFMGASAKILLSKKFGEFSKYYFGFLILGIAPLLTSGSFWLFAEFWGLMTLFFQRKSMMEEEY